MAITLIVQTGLFSTQYEQWHERADGQKTWAYFKEFWKAKIELKANTNLNAQAFGFGGNAAEQQDTNVEHEFNNSIANFADAHNQTQSTISNLTNTNMQLSNAVAQLQQQMNMMPATMNQMAMYGAQNSNANKTPWANNTNNNRKTKKNNRNNGNNGGWTGYGNTNNANTNNNAAGNTNPRPAHVKLFNNDNYCWTHGHDQPSDHCSMTCMNRHPNHNQNATKQNTMGGNPANAERTVWPQKAGFPEIVPKRLRQQNNQQQQQWNTNQPKQFGGNSMHTPMQTHFCMPTGQPTQQMPMQQPFMANHQMGQQQFGGSMMQGYPMGGQRFF